MATSPKTATNKQHAAFPTLFNRNGEARRIKGFRATREMFSRCIRMAKVLEMSPRLIVLTPVGALFLSEPATKLLKEEGGVESLLLNGFDILPARDVVMHEMVDSFLKENKLDLKQVDMFEDDATGA
jgi:hypothetical protein